MKKKAVILGAGISGLSLGLKLCEKLDILVIEKKPVVGGLCASFKYKDCILDYGPHKLYSQLPGIMEEFRKLLGKDCLKVKKKNSLRLIGKYFEFPVKITQLVKNITPRTVAMGVSLGLGYIFALSRNIWSKKRNISYEDYFINGFGKEGYHLLFRDMAWKVWGNPRLLTEELARKRVPIPSVSTLIKSMLLKKVMKKVSAEYFYCPKEGMGFFCDRIALEIKKNRGVIALNSVPTSINLKNNKVKSVTYTSKGKSKKVNTHFLISTIPITELPHLIKPSPPKEILDATKNLKYRALILVYLVIDAPRIMDDIWIFFLNKEVIFNRVAEQKGFSQFTVPEDKTVIMVDLTAEVGDNTWNYSDNHLTNLVIRDLKKVGILKHEKIINTFVKRFKNVYPLYFIRYKENLNKILDYIDTIPNLFTIGRYGMFNYNNMDHCIDMSYITAEHILNKRTKKDWKQKRKYFDSYRIVD